MYNDLNTEDSFVFSVFELYLKCVVMLYERENYYMICNAIIFVNLTFYHITQSA